MIFSTLTKPESITYTIPSQVNDASAMFVDTITLRESLGVNSNIRNCSCKVRPA